MKAKPKKLGVFLKIKVAFFNIVERRTKPKKVDDELKVKGLAPKEMGKGRNVWYCVGMALARGEADAIALHDCDIITYERRLLAKLFYPVANPNFNYEFCKGYYPRYAKGKLNGRASRLLVYPLLVAMEKTIGKNEYLEFMKSFKYPLAGEFSFKRFTKGIKNSY